MERIRSLKTVVKMWDLPTSLHKKIHLQGQAQILNCRHKILYVQLRLLVNLLYLRNVRLLSAFRPDLEFNFGEGKAFLILQKVLS